MTPPELTLFDVEPTLAGGDTAGAANASRAEAPRRSGTPVRASLPAATLTISTAAEQRDTVGIELSPGATDPNQRLRISGAVNCTISVDGNSVQPDADGHIEVALPAGTRKPIRISRAARPERTETFRLFFDKDEPRGQESTLSTGLADRYIRGVPSEPDDH